MKVTSAGRLTTPTLLAEGIILANYTKRGKPAKPYPARTVGILDLYHVMEYLWKTAHYFHSEKSDAAEGFVTARLRLVL